MCTLCKSTTISHGIYAYTSNSSFLSENTYFLRQAVLCLLSRLKIMSNIVIYHEQCTCTCIYTRIYYLSPLLLLSLFPYLPLSPLCTGIHHQFTEEPAESLEVERGRTALLRCRFADSNPPAILHWKKDGHPIIPDNERVILSPSGYLYIRNVSELDTGEYQCLAENTVTGKRRRSNISTLTVNGECVSRWVCMCALATQSGLHIYGIWGGNC